MAEWRGQPPDPQKDGQVSPRIRGEGRPTPTWAVARAPGWVVSKGGAGTCARAVGGQRGVVEGVYCRAL
eukprot:1051267-Prymnesium_polylepis.1